MPIDFEHERSRRGSRGSIYSLEGRWPLIATSATRLHAEGHLAAVWERLDVRTGPAVALTDLPVRHDMKPADLSTALGRRWRKDHPDFWARLSPLGIGRARTSQDEAQSTPLPADPEGEAFTARIQQLREADLEGARRDAAAFGAAAPEADLRFPPINGSMDDREDDVEEEP